MIARLIAFIFLLYGPATLADEFFPTEGRLTGFFGPYVCHFTNAHHNDLPRATGLEWEPRGFPLEIGAVYFMNSYYQDSLYAYLGKRWFISGEKEGVFLNLTGGLLYGYRGDHEHKVPFNHDGLGIAIAPTIGYQYRAVNAQLVVLGNAVVVTFGYDFWR